MDLSVLENGIYILWQTSSPPDKDQVSDPGSMGPLVIDFSLLLCE